MAQNGIFCSGKDPVLSHCYLLALGKVHEAAYLYDSHPSCGTINNDIITV